MFTTNVVDKVQEMYKDLQFIRKESQQNTPSTRGKPGGRGGAHRSDIEPRDSDNNRREWPRDGGSGWARGGRGSGNWRGNWDGGNNGNNYRGQARDNQHRGGGWNREHQAGRGGGWGQPQQQQQRGRGRGGDRDLMNVLRSLVNNNGFGGGY